MNSLTIELHYLIYLVLIIKLHFFLAILAFPLNIIFQFFLLLYSLLIFPILIGPYYFYYYFTYHLKMKAFINSLLNFLAEEVLLFSFLYDIYFENPNNLFHLLPIFNNLQEIHLTFLIDPTIIIINYYQVSLFHLL